MAILYFIDKPLDIKFIQARVITAETFLIAESGTWTAG
jgi:hypothetical protein